MTLDEIITKYQGRVETKASTDNLDEEQKKQLLNYFYDYVTSCLVGIQFSLLTPEEQAFYKAIKPKAPEDFVDAYAQLTDKFPDVKTRLLTAEASTTLEEKLSAFEEGL